jgi:hypothetical protein
MHCTARPLSWLLLPLVLLMHSCGPTLGVLAVAGKSSGDSTAPAQQVSGTRFIASPPVASGNALAIFAFTSGVDASYEASLDGQAFRKVSNPLRVTVTEGPHVLRVRALNCVQAEFNNPPSHAWTVDLTPPSPVTLGGIESLAARSLDLRWTPSTDSGTGIRGYRVYYGSADGPPYNGPGSPQEVADVASARVSGLVPCGFYWMAVTAVDRAGNESRLGSGTRERVRCGGDGMFPERVEIAGSGSGVGMTTGDFDSDGLPDLAVTQSAGNDVDGRVAALRGLGQGRFEPLGTTAVQRAPVDLLTFDANLDGVLDLAILNNRGSTGAETDGSVTVLLGQVRSPGHGNGTFTAVSYSLPATPQPVKAQAGDFNADGAPDLVVAGFTPAGVPGNLTVMLGQRDPGGRPNGQFQLQVEATAATGVLDMAAADFDLDGVLDLALTCSGDSIVRVLLGQKSAGGRANGRFLESVPAQVRFPANRATLLAGVTAGDLNGDAIQDLVVTDRSSDDNDDAFVCLGELSQQGTLTFRNSSTLLVGPFIWPMALADLNADGTLDLAIPTGIRNEVAVLLGTRGPDGRGNGGFAPPTRLPTALGPNTVAVADVDGNGSPDLLVRCALSQISLFRNDGGSGQSTGAFEPGVRYTPGSPAVAVRRADFHGDGILDLALAQAPRELVLLRGLGRNGQGHGAFIEDGRHALAAPPTDLDERDLDADGMVDLAVLQNDGQALVLWAQSGAQRGRFAPSPPVAAGSAPGGPIRCGDFNLDGIGDLLVLRPQFSPLSLGVLFGGRDPSGRPSRTFPTRQAFDAGPAPVAAEVHDVDHDGRPDLLVLDQGAGTTPVARVLMLRGNGTGGIAGSVATVLTGRPAGMVITDGNDDNRPDLVVATDRRLLVLEGLGDGRFNEVQSLDVGSAPVTVELLEVTGDGALDLVVTTRGANLEVFAGEVQGGVPNGRFRPFASLPQPSAGAFVLAGDFNADGVADLAFGGDGLVVWLARGRF